MPATVLLALAASLGIWMVAVGNVRVGLVVLAVAAVLSKVVVRQPKPL